VLPGTDGVDQPFWSPDSRFVAFFSEGKLRKIDITGGRPQTICDAPPARSGSWNEDGIIVFTPGSGAGLHMVPAAGGVPQPLTTLDRSRAESDHLWPEFLPGGQRFVYLARSANPQQTALYLGSIDGKTRELLLNVDSNAAFSPPGYLIYQREGTLMARRFDDSRGQFTDQEFSLGVTVGYNTANGRGAFSVSRTGVLAYRAGPDDAANEAVWFDRTGNRVGSLGLSDVSPDAWLSTDGTTLAFSRADRRTATSIWLSNLAQKTLSRFTFGPGIDVVPFPPTGGGKWQISTAGGFQPRWRGDEREMFYLAADGRILAVPIRSGEQFEHGVPQPLFQTRLDTPALINDRNYEPTEDGQRFLVTTPLGTSVPIAIVVNWAATVR
jgi:eukaryotic-like serine/threonine-protein kinase